MELKKIHVVFLLILLVACQDDEVKITSSLVGKWRGENVNFKINPDGVIPAFTVPEDNFPIVIEFKNDGALILTDEQRNAHNGTYILNGTSLTISIDYKFEYIELSGIYQVEELTETILRASIEKTGTFEHPDYGQVNGKVKATLFFTRI